MYWRVHSNLLRIQKDLDQKQFVFAIRQRFSKTHNDIEFGKEVKTIIVVDIWLNSLGIY